MNTSIQDTAIAGLLSQSRFTADNLNFLDLAVNEYIIAITGQSLPILMCVRKGQIPGPYCPRPAPDHVLTPMTHAEPEHALVAGLKVRKSG
jgi:hypothetical protein